MVGKDLEMGSSDEMSDDEQLQWLEDIDELDDPDEPIMEGSDDALHPVTIITTPTRQLTLTTVPHGLPPSIQSPSSHSDLQPVQPFRSLPPI